MVEGTLALNDCWVYVYFGWVGLREKAKGEQ